jgi:hypothetical protein
MGIDEIYYSKMLKLCMKHEFMWTNVDKTMLRMFTHNVY